MFIIRWSNKLEPLLCHMNLKYKIWRPCWRILKRNKRKARKSVDTMRNNLDDGVSFLINSLKYLIFYYTFRHK